MWQASLGVEIPAKVDTGIAYIDETNIDEWIAMVSE
jgi:ribose transport system substrate-binding protein